MQDGLGTTSLLISVRQRVQSGMATALAAGTF